LFAQLAVIVLTSKLSSPNNNRYEFDMKDKYMLGDPVSSLLDALPMLTFNERCTVKNA